MCICWWSPRTSHGRTLRSYESAHCPRCESVPSTRVWSSCCYLRMGSFNYNKSISIILILICSFIFFSLLSSHLASLCSVHWRESRLARQPATASRPPSRRSSLPKFMLMIAHTFRFVFAFAVPFSLSSPYLFCTHSARWCCCFFFFLGLFLIK